MTDENKNEFYVEIWWISREGTAGYLYACLSMVKLSADLFSVIML